MVYVSQPKFTGIFCCISFTNRTDMQFRLDYSRVVSDHSLKFHSCRVHWGFTGLTLSRTSTIGENSVLGSGTEIGEGTIIKRSVIGRGCRIGKNVSIEGCHIWDNVTIEDDAQLQYSVVCDGAIVKAGAVLKPGVVLSFKVSSFISYRFFSSIYSQHSKTVHHYALVFFVSCFLYLPLFPSSVPLVWSNDC